MTLQSKVATITELINVASLCGPCCSDKNVCLLYQAVKKALPTLNSMMHEMRLRLLVHPEETAIKIPTTTS